VTVVAVAAAAVLAAVIGAAAGAPPAVAPPAYAEGAPPGFSGGFGEEACDACHFSARVDTGPGAVTITGLPAHYAPGERYPLGVTLTRAGMTLAGLQLTARFADGGGQAGTLTVAAADSPRLAVETHREVQYLGQRQAGTAVDAPGAARWSLVWTAPASGGPVIVHVAANAANGDGTAEGDFVHTASARSDPAEVALSAPVAPALTGRSGRGSPSACAPPRRRTPRPASLP
jgi:hypothetical protein